MRYPIALLALHSLLACAPAGAQTLAQRVTDAPDGRVRLSFPARPGACGYGDAIMIRHPEGGSDRVRMLTGAGASWNMVQESCVEGPVFLDLTVSGHQVRRVHPRVGVGYAPTSERVTDLGSVSAADAVQLLVDLAPRVQATNRDDPLFPVALADVGDAAPRLLRLATDERAPVRVRSKAVFWAAEAGADAAPLSDLYARATEPEIREQILFAYSRLRDPAAARELLRVARGGGEMELRKKAVFWLSQRAGQEVTRDLGELVGSESEDEKLREHAIFALSQRPRDEAVPALIQVARANPSPRLRQRALFWLGQTGDPRAVDLFEAILAGTK